MGLRKCLVTLNIESLSETIVAIIPARSGSKSVPRKNIAMVAGKPLIAWTIETALSCPSLSRVIVSTDDSQIAEVARSYGAEVPFLRPSELAQDDTPDLPVFQHVLAWLREHEGYLPDILVHLRPTSPLRRVEDIEGAIAKLWETNADCVRSVCSVEHHPYWMKRLVGDRLVPFVEGHDERSHYQRQLLPPVYRLNGAVDVMWARNVVERGFLYGGDMRAYVMDRERSVDLDSELDFALVEVLIQKRGLI